MFSSRAALACPQGVPRDFIFSSNTKDRSYTNVNKTVEVIVKCDERVKPIEAIKALHMIGPVHFISKSISYAELKAGAMRLYIGTTSGVTQVAVIAKTPEALEKAAPAIIEYLKN